MAYSIFVLILIASSFDSTYAKANRRKNESKKNLSNESLVNMTKILDNLLINYNRNDRPGLMSGIFNKSF